MKNGRAAFLHLDRTIEEEDIPQLEIISSTEKFQLTSKNDEIPISETFSSAPKFIYRHLGPTKPEERAMLDFIKAKVIHL